VSAGLDRLLKDIRACQICAQHLPHEPRPVLRARASARIVIAGQAPGTRVHASGMPFTDPSGDRLRDWMGVDKETFYDDTKIAIVPMGFCFPGLDAKGSDLPPRKECAPAWREQVFAHLKQIKLTLLVGSYAQAWHLKGRAQETLTETVESWRDYGPNLIPLPHPSWRNNAWLKKNPWFEAELLPHLRRRIARILNAKIGAG
jgi:uracil-DNA glycosylase